MFSPLDQTYLDTVTDPVLKEKIVCQLQAFRQPDAMFPGDAMPALSLAELGNGRVVALDRKRDRPLVLLFGSFT